MINSLKTKKILVTGGAGFIGSHIVQRLLKEGNSVVVLDNFFSGKRENLSFVNDLTLGDGQYRLIEGDIRNYDDCLQSCKGVNVIFHQAALRSVPRSFNNPYDYNEVNINGMLNVLEAAKANKVKRVVFASSSSIYGDTDKFPQTEGQYPLLISPYALSKLTGEYYCRIYSQNFGLETVSLRYFNVFGPRQALDDDYAVVIPKFIDCILKDRQPPIHGTGKQSRDFTYIDNVVEANILAAVTVGVGGSVLNVACGKTHSILDLVEIINKTTNKSIKPVFTPPRVGDVFRTHADISQAQALLGFKPAVEFEEGLKRTVEWVENK
ncbi:MAG: SDR family oxidoreductase [Candidatus Omnitrophota bacterium]|nr:SDR family oxidoreductase [Candidatus Omnitrophota bacterium]